MKNLRLFPKLIDYQMNLGLEFEVTKEKLKAVVNSLRRAKSLGPDGWKIEFYIRFYYMLGKDILEVVENINNQKRF
jgi:hypothetical protein